MMTVRTERRANLKALVGDEFEEILRSKDYAIKSLENSNHRVRAAAVSVLSVDFCMDDDCVVALQRVVGDSDTDVRTAARLALAHKFRSASKPMAWNLYRAVILDEGVDTFTRFDTYVKLLQLDGAPPERICQLIKELEEPSLANIDWDVVNRGEKKGDGEIKGDGGSF